MMTLLLQDLRHSARSLLKQPGFTSVVILTVALAVGANSAMFSVLNGVLLTPLPYERAEQLVIVAENDRLRGTEREGVSGPDYFDWLERQRVFARMAAWTSQSLTMTAAATAPERLQTTYASHTLFSTLGWQAELGRTFSAEEDRPGGELGRAIEVSPMSWRKGHELIARGPQVVEWRPQATFFRWFQALKSLGGS